MDASKQPRRRNQRLSRTRHTGERRTPDGVRPAAPVPTDRVGQQDTVGPSSGHRYSPPPRPGSTPAASPLTARPRRVAERLRVVLERSGLSRAAQVEGLTEALSESGMLIRSMRELTVGEQVGFELVLESSEGRPRRIRGEAEVVRRTGSGGLGIRDGFGLRFLRFTADGGELVRAHIGALVDGTPPDSMGSGARPSA